ncbi:hypothetical protein I350_08388 [Cryptococcus amylolentus CBS 6273]|uniref:Uncharacterized protein n=1 Tax=Cryptococcus amylolentus CBS 6273 TaxID=1296118 RepID=A0A1E3J6V3_9TREE|nr:hypothetical protein I350_08388 [Cryptococcus amylolentus CBS 6273]
MADHTVIVQFKKTSSSEDRKKAISELTSKGAKIVSDENADSKIFPFITVSYPKDDFSSLESSFGGGSHDVVQHVDPFKWTGGGRNGWRVETLMRFYGRA